MFYDALLRPGPHDLAIYWGNELMYRRVIRVGVPVVAPGTIVL